MRARFVKSLFILGVVAALSGCGEGVENAAKDSASSVASDAKSKAQQIGRDAARSELCQYVTDKKVSPAEAVALKASADVAEKAGVSQPLVDAARTVANASQGNAPQNDVEKFAQECEAAA